MIPQSFTVLPAYTVRQSLTRPPPRGPTLHIYDLKSGKGRPWLILKVASRAPASSCLPHFYEGDTVMGSVDLDLQKETQIKVVTVAVHGEIIATHNVRYTFLQVSKEVWSASTGVSRISSDSGPSDQQVKGKLRGQYSWPFSVDIPSEVELKHQRSTQRYRLPASFYVRGARVTIRYRFYVTVVRGKFQVDSELGTQLGYTPITRPDPPSLARQLAYQENTPLVGPDGDPDGWHRMSPVALRGKIFSSRAIEVRLSLSLARPLCYTRSSVIPLALDIESADQQALDIIASPKAPQVRLLRTFSMGYDADWGRAGHSARQTDLQVDDAVATTSTGDLTDELQSAVWWEPSRGDPVTTRDRRTLHGEVHLLSSLPPSSHLGHFRIHYTLALFAPRVVAFTADCSEKRPLQSIAIEIATAYPRCPRPISYLPPDYESLHSDAADSRIYDAIVYG